MPIRGESVGTAYVRIVGDGSGIPDDIREAFEDADPAISDAGDRHAKTYKKSFIDEIDSHQGGSLSDALVDAMAKKDFTKRFFAGNNWKDFERNMKLGFGKVGASSAEELKKEFLARGNLDGIEDEVHKMFSRMHTDIDRDEHLFIRMSQTIDKMADGFARAFGKGSRNDFLNFTGSVVGGMLRMVGVIPRVLGNFGEFTSAFGDARREGQGLFDSLRSGFTRMSADAEGGATAISRMASEGLPGIVLLVAGVGALVAALGPIAALISGVTGAVIALAGSIAFGLVGAVAPLVGLLGPLVFIIPAIVAGVVSFVKHGKELKEIVQPLVGLFKSLGNSVREGFLQTFNVKRGVDGIGDALRDLFPVFGAIGEGIGDVATRLTHIGDSPQWQRFVRAMTVFVPEAIDKLTTAAFNMGAAFADIFVDLIPTTSDFLDWLVKITREFRDWVHENPKEIKDFFHDAADSLEAIGSFLGPVARLVGTLFSGGRKTGDSIFRDLGEQVDRFDQFLKDNPDAMKDFFANAGETARQLGRMARGLGEIFDTLDTPGARKTLHMFLDAATWVLQFSDALLNILSPVHLVITIFQHLRTAVNHAKTAIGNFFSSLGQGGGGRGVGALAIKPPNLSWIPGALTRVQNFAGNVVRVISGIAGRIAGPVANMADPFVRAANHMVSIMIGAAGKLVGLASRFGSAAAAWGTRIVSAISSVPGRILNLFAGLGSMISNIIGSIHIDWPSPPGWVSKLVPGMAVGGIVSGAQHVIVGEAGAEAVVPLERPLNQIDPSVRWLAAIAQGRSAVGVDPVSVAPGKTINNEFHIVQSGIDPVAAANEVVARLVASAI